MTTRSEAGVLEVDGSAWRTPVTDHAGEAYGEARLKRSWYSKDDLYPMEGVGGYEVWQVVKSRLPVTELQVRTMVKGRRSWRTWMVDDPLHWFGMGERVEDLAPGTALVAGLGLGLMLHHVARKPNLTKVVVVERSQDVIELITPTLPVDPRVTIVCDDFYEYARTARQPDSVLWDLAVGDPSQTGPEMLQALAKLEWTFPTAELIMFGLRGRGSARGKLVRSPRWVGDRGTRP